MHIQSRSVTALSPADLVAFLEVLADDVGDGPINVEGVTGSALEKGGTFAFSLPHDRQEEGVQRLRNAGYTVDETEDLYFEPVPSAQDNDANDPNHPGALVTILRNARDSQIAAGRPIHEILIGAVTNSPGDFYVQVTFADPPFFDPDI